MLAATGLVEHVLGHVSLRTSPDRLLVRCRGPRESGLAWTTGRDVREAAAEIEPATGAVVHAFTTGTMVQVFSLAKLAFEDTGSGPKLDRWANETGQEMFPLPKKFVE